MTDEKEAGQSSSIELAGSHQLRIQRAGAEEGASDTVELINREGAVVFAVELSERGPVLRFEGPALTLRAAGELSLEAEKLSLRSEKGLEVESGGDLAIRAAGDLVSKARTQRIEAELGDVEVEANDDVRIDGERVLVNCG